MKHEKFFLGMFSLLLTCAGVLTLVACRGEEPEEIKDKPVVTWTVLEKTDTSCRLRFVNGVGCDLCFGDAFVLSRVNDAGQLTRLPFDTEREIKDIAWLLPEGGKIEKTYSWENLFDQAPAGKLALTVSFYADGTEHQTVVLLPETETGADETDTPSPAPTDESSSVTPSPAADKPVVTENPTDKPTATPYPVGCYTPVPTTGTPTTGAPTKVPAGDDPIEMPEDKL